MISPLFLRILRAKHRQALLTGALVVIVSVGAASQLLPSSKTQINQPPAVPTPLGPATTNGDPSPQDPPKPATPLPQPTTGQDSLPNLHIPDSETTPSEPAVELAEQFAQLWARPTVSVQTWWGELVPLCEKGFAERLHTVDPARVPANQVTGPGKPTISRRSYLEVAVPTNAGVLTVHLVLSVADGQWKVSGTEWGLS